jgi:hypothetical protein
MYIYYIYIIITFLFEIISLKILFWYKLLVTITFLRKKKLNKLEMSNYFLLQKYQDTAQILHFNKIRFKIRLVRFVRLDVAG